MFPSNWLRFQIKVFIPFLIDFFLHNEKDTGSTSVLLQVLPGFTSAFCYRNSLSFSATCFWRPLSKIRCPQLCQFISICLFLSSTGCLCQCGFCTTIQGLAVPPALFLHLGIALATCGLGSM